MPPYSIRLDRDPNITEIVKICESEMSAINFCQEMGLFPNIDQTELYYLTENCSGTLKNTVVKDKNNIYPIIRCNSCKTKRSVHTKIFKKIFVCPYLLHCY